MNSKSSRRRTVTFAVTVAVAIGVVFFLLPQLGDLSDILDRISQGDPWWLLLALALEIGSFFCYVALFRAVYVEQGDERIGWGASYQITMAGVAATRLFAAAGAGGVALTYWALRRSGMGRREVSHRIVMFMVLMYAVFVITLLVDGIFLRTGIFFGKAPFALTLIPAAFAGTVIFLFVLIMLIPGDLERRLELLARGNKRMARLARRLATGPAVLAAGTRDALRLVWKRQLGVLGAPGWWAFDLAVLWACFHAFGDAPPTAVLVMGYFVGMIANLLPLPGGVGAVEGGMLAAFVGFGVPYDAALVAVLSYRGFSFWLPTIPGAVAYLQLRRTIKTWDEQLDEGEQAESVVAAGSV